MALVLGCVSGLLLLGGTVVLFNAQRTWDFRKFVDNYAPSQMPEYWETTNRGIGVGMIAAGLLLIFLGASFI